MSRSTTLVDYPNRKRGSEPSYLLIEQAIRALVIEGRRPEAVRAIEAAIDGFLASGDERGEARARSKAAIVFRSIGQLDRAKQEAEAALAFFSNHPDPPFEACAYLELGQTHEALGNFAAALQTYEQGLTRLGDDESGEREQLRRTRAFIRDCAANVHAHRGELDRARWLREKAIPVFEQLKLSNDAVTGWTNLAQDDLRADDITSATKALEGAFKWLKKLDLNTAEGQRQRANVHAVEMLIAHRQLDRTGDPADKAGLREISRRAARRAFELYESIDQRERAASVLLSQAEVELSSGSVEEAGDLLRLAERRVPSGQHLRHPLHLHATLRRNLDSLKAKHFMASAKGTDAEEPFQKLLQDVEKLLPSKILRLRGEWSMRDSPLVPSEAEKPQPFQFADPCDKFPAAWSALDAGRTLDEIEKRKSADLRRLLEVPERVQGAMALPKRALKPEPRNVSRAEPRSAGGVREVFVDYYTDSGHTFAILEFAGEKPQIFNVSATPDEIADCVQKLRRLFDRSKYSPGIDPDDPWRVDLDFIDRAGRRLMPFLNDLREANLVCFFPHGPLHNFPFHMVRGDSGEPLVRHMAVTYSFSRKILSLMRSGHFSQSGERVFPQRALTVGVPRVGERNPSTFLGDGEYLASLGLTVVALEEPTQATVAKVIREMRNTDLVHFNCHGLFFVDRPLDSALLLSDGLEGPRSAHGDHLPDRKKHLSARRLFRERASVSTVVLRACSSGVTNVRVGDEQVGLLRALINMGAASCIVTRWNIHQRSSRELLRSMYRYWLVDRLPKALALQRAQQDMMIDAKSRAWQHPFHWAPFILVGDW